MSKRVNRAHRTNWTRFIAGLFVGGVLLFQGTGYITGNLSAANNENVDVSSGAVALTETDRNFGVYGTPTGGDLIINGINDGERATAVVGELETTSEALNVTAAAAITVGEEESGYYDIIVGGTDASTLTGSGILYIAGNEEGASSLTTGGDVLIGSGGLLRIGSTTDFTEDGTGSLRIYNGGSLYGEAGTLTDLATGLEIGAGSSLIIGGTAEDEEGDPTLMTGGMDIGDMNVANSGTIDIRNEAGTDNRVVIFNYSDAAGTALSATGDLYVLQLDRAIDGTVTGADLQYAVANDDEYDTLTVNADADVIASGLLTVGDDTEVGLCGVTLAVSNDATVKAGGIRAIEYVATDSDTGAETVYGGDLTISAEGTGTSSAGAVTVTGLTEKFTDGTNQVYDVNLDGVFDVQGTWTFDDGDAETTLTSGVMFDGAAKVGTSPANNTDAAVNGIIASEGDLKFYGKNATANSITVAGGTTASTYDGSYMDIGGELAFDHVDGSTMTVTNNGRIWANSMTLDDASLTYNNTTLQLTDGTTDDTTAGSDAYTVLNQLTLKAGNISGSFHGMEEDEVASAFSLEEGIEEDDAVLLTGNVSFTDTTFTINGGSLANSGDNTYTANFEAADVINNANGALAVDSIFSTGSSYSGGKAVNGSMTFNSGSTLELTEGETLTLAAGKDLTVESGGVINVNFADDAESVSLVKLSNAVNDEGTVTDEGIAILAEGSEINLTEDILTKKGNDYSLTLIETAAGNITDSSTFETAESAFYTLSKELVETDEQSQLNLNLTVKDFEDLGETANEKSFGRYVDSFRTDEENYSEELGGMLSDIMDLESADDVRAVYNELSAASKANSLMLAMSDPWQNAFDQMNWGTHRGYTKKGPNPYGQYGRICRGQDSEYVVYEEGAEAEYGGYYGGYYGQGFLGSVLNSVFCPYNSMEPNSAWASFHHTSFSARTDDNSDNYGISRSGVTVGYDLISAENVIAGLMFDYSQPYLYMNDDRINMGDFKLGFYGKREYSNQMELSLYIGGGFQDYIYKRTVSAPAIGQDARFRTTYSGGSLAGAIQLAKNIDLNYWSVIRPFVQFDTQQVWQDAVDEDAAVSVTALRYNKADWNRSFVRAGFETEANNQFMRLTSRVFYSGQIGGDSAPEMEAGFMGDYSGNIMTIQGVDLGESFFDVGVGALGYLDCDYRWAISGNYDFAASDKSNAHTGVVSLSYSF